MPKLEVYRSFADQSFLIYQHMADGLLGDEYIQHLSTILYNRRLFFCFALLPFQEDMLGKLINLKETALRPSLPPVNVSETFSCNMKTTSSSNDSVIGLEELVNAIGKSFLVDDLCNAKTKLEASNLPIRSPAKHFNRRLSRLGSAIV